MKKLLNGSKLCTFTDAVCRRQGIKNSNCGTSLINTNPSINNNPNSFLLKKSNKSPMQFFVDSCNRSHTLPPSFKQQIAKKN